MVQVERLPATSYLVATVPPFRDVASWLPLFDRIAYRGPTILVGPKGVGKSLGWRSWAYTNKVPIVTVDCSEDLRRSQLVGGFILRGEQTPFVLGPLTTAIAIANETGHAILNLEEVNALSPQAQKLLNSLTDFRQAIEVPEANAVFRVEPGKKLWVVGSMNFANYGGVYQLNEDLMSRMRFVRCGYPPEDEERALLMTAIEEDVAKTLAETPNLIEMTLTLAHETRQASGVEYALSPRDLVQVLTDLALLGPENALTILLGKFEDVSRTVMIERIKSIFGVEVH